MSYIAAQSSPSPRCSILIFLRSDSVIRVRRDRMINATESIFLLIIKANFITFFYHDSQKNHTLSSYHMPASKPSQRLQNKKTCECCSKLDCYTQAQTHSDHSSLQDNQTVCDLLLGEKSVQKLLKIIFAARYQIRKLLHPPLQPSLHGILHKKLLLRETTQIVKNQRNGELIPEQNVGYLLGWVRRRWDKPSHRLPTR